MIIKAPINLELTQMSGQTSQPPWSKNNNIYSNNILINNELVEFQVKQNNEFLEYDFKGNINEKEAESRIKYIFDLDFNLNKFYKYLDNHDELCEMSRFCNGLRLFLASNPFECIISSICSANNSIKRWTKSISDIKEKFSENNIFPSPQTLQKVYIDSDEEYDKTNSNDIHKCTNNLKECGVGYRAPYMRRASEIFTLEIDVLEISKMKYEEAYETILKIPGVGPKVADCILLYGFNFKQAFPTDIWIKRIISHLYFEGADISVGKVREFGMEEFKDNAGYVQLYLFHYARMSGLMKKIN